MSKATTISLIIIIVIISSYNIEATELQLLSRSLLQKSPRDVANTPRGLVLATGGALALVGPGDSDGYYTFIPLDGEPYSLSTRGNIVYAAAMGKGLVTVDLGDPDGPAVKNTWACDQATQCCVSDETLLLYDIKKGLVLFDITDPLSPSFLSRVPAAGRPSDMVCVDNMPIIVYPDRAVRMKVDREMTLIEDSTIDPGQPIIASSAGGGVLFLILADGTVLALAPASPVTEGLTLDLPGSSKAIDISVIDISASGGEGLIMLDSGAILPFTFEGTRIDIGKKITAGYADHEDVPLVRMPLSSRLRGRKESARFPGTSLAAGSDRFVTFDPKEGFWIYDTRTPGNAEFNGFIGTKGYAIDLVASKGYLYLANGRDGVRTGKIRDDGSIDWCGHIQTHVARDLAVSDNILILADGGDGLKTYDISDPRAPEYLGHMESPFFLCSIVTSGDYAFVAGGLGGAEIVDISDPRKPRLVWRDKFSEVRGIFADEERFYLSDGFAGFKIFEFDGKQPTLLASIDTPGWNSDMFADGRYLYMGEGGYGIAVVDISDPSDPVITGKVNFPSIAREIHYLDGTLFTASNKNGLNAIDVSDPRAPFVSANFPSVDDGRGVFADSRFVYFASGAGGVYIFRYQK
ncbi:MAG: hypothetical protein KAV42_09110 [Candidatus Krumholzibacteria bacterium]|nr:hypothetical protein [Candidatus Krumholzibacteria bacterium]